MISFPTASTEWTSCWRISEFTAKYDLTLYLLLSQTSYFLKRLVLRQLEDQVTTFLKKHREY
jgi:hypothetical protein